ncbi:tRNA glutamyl-Q(34) synthetase GluQRS [Defluviimonas sp. WL0050]|uniref:tRNA glutamyl-Q(34) synthetase GluQRS n=1 Tax=Albidovulum litorale TaxID=2984134 RepID=A0ABT2ZQC1_9RHOB|nr:tRNA glutamyl-Q(34) synthetase GluQRS [Defluviimonas sp. WL0050]MCV2873312.1 tRNA glutamyl-Q(34) synthetase GluQRS [Defluviimonas sp. WL0050]
MRTRFAPSPTGPLHLGHAYSALFAHDMALRAGGEFLLRIEDIDQSRARPEWEELIYDDLSWLGLSWETPVVRQSDRLPVYRDTLTKLWNSDTLFACTCNRRDILAATSAPNEGEPVTGPDGIVYPGTCRAHRSDHGRLPIPDDAALRLDMGYAARAVSDPRAGGNVVTFQEAGHGPKGETGFIDTTTRQLTDDIGDVVLARRDMGTSYHLSVVIDDAEQGITHVTRGQDLFEATKIHVVLQRLLVLPTPVYHHHRLIRDDQGKRLAKRDDARAIRTYRDDGASPEDIRRLVGLS